MTNEPIEWVYLKREADGYVCKMPREQFEEEERFLDHAGFVVIDPPQNESTEDPTRDVDQPKTGVDGADGEG